MRGQNSPLFCAEGRRSQNHEKHRQGGTGDVAVRPPKKILVADDIGFLCNKLAVTLTATAN